MVTAYLCLFVFSSSLSLNSSLDLANLGSFLGKAAERLAASRNNREKQFSSTRLIFAPRKNLTVCLSNRTVCDFWLEQAANLENKSDAVKEAHQKTEIRT